MPNFYFIDNAINPKPKRIELEKGSTPDDFKKKICKKNFILPTVCVIHKKNSEPIYLSRQEWKEYIVGDGEECYFISFPQETFTTALVVSLIISVVIGVGTYLLTPRPKLNQNQFDLDSSPTYNLTSQGNRMRLGQPKPVHYGTIRAYPDIISAPWTESISNKRHYHSLMNFGYGKIEITDIRIDDTDLSTFPWVDYNIRYPGDAPTALFPKPNIISKEINNVTLTDESSFYYYVLNDANPISKVKNIYFDFFADQGVFYSGGHTSKGSIKVATSVNIDVNNLPATIDSVAMNPGDVFLAFNQNDWFENGILIYTGVGLAATDALAGSGYDYSQASVFINNGSHAGKRFRQYLWNATGNFFGYPRLFVQYDTSLSINRHEITIQISVQEIDSLGVNVGSAILKYYKFIAKETSPYYYSCSYSHPTPGRFKVAIRQGHSSAIDVNNDASQFSAYTFYDKDTNTNLNTHDKSDWIQYRGELDFPEPTFNNLTLLEMKIQASGKLNDSNIGIFNGLGKRWLWVWDFTGLSWSFIQTDSPLWAFVDMATSGIMQEEYGLDFTISPDTSMVVVPNPTINMDNLEMIYESIKLLGLKCNVRFDTGLSGEECLAQIAQSMRCQVYERGGQKLLARDEEKQIISGFFSRDNIINGDIRVGWIHFNDSTATWFRITYFDETTGKKETVECVLAGMDNTGIVEELELHTITNRTKAWQEGMFYCAQNAYRRKMLSFSTDLEGYLPTICDHISVSHPRISNCFSGKIEKIIGSTIYLSEPVYFDGFETGLISFKKKDGTVSGPYICGHGANQYSVEMVKFSTATPDWTLFPFYSKFDEPDFEPTYYTFGVQQQSVIAVVKSFTPSGNNEGKLECVVHDPRVHTADKPIFLVPPLGSEYVAHPAFVCGGDNNECMVNIATKLVTVKFDYSGYAGYKVRYLFNVGGVENTITQTVYTGVAGIKTDTYTYPTNPPSRVTVTPIIDIEISPPSQEELLSLAVVIPIQLL